jgi:glucose/arabinose dehydrogenase
MKMEFKNQFDMQLYPSALKAAFGKLSAARRDAAAAAAATIAAAERVTAAATGPAAAAAAAGARTTTQAEVVVDELEEIVAFANGPPGQVNAMLGDDLEDIERMREAGIIVITEEEQF